MKFLSIIALMLFTVPAFAANECAGTPYRNLGKSCADLGLDSNRAVCRPGDRVALMCDDTAQGQVRTCRTNIRCGDYGDRRDWQDWRRDDRGGFPGFGGYPGGRYDDRGPFGYGGRVAEGTTRGPWVFYRGDWRRCEDLEFNRRHEPRGFCSSDRVNTDCSGRCERVYR